MKTDTQALRLCAFAVKKFKPLIPIAIGSKNAKKYTGMVWLVLFIFSCQKDITIKELPFENQLSIECILRPGTLPRLYLSNSVAFFSASVKPSEVFVRNATALISGTGGTQTLVMD